MKQTGVIEGNKLIAEFMGFKVANGTTARTTEIKYATLLDGDGDEVQKFRLENLQYHTSWEWLMPVVEKIEDMGYKTLIGGGDAFGNFAQIMFSKTDEEHRRLFHSPAGGTKALQHGKNKLEAT